MPTREDLKTYQSFPLAVKVDMTKARIKEWVDTFEKDGVYISFSGGKDSTVLLHLVREMYGNDIPAVFVNTGLEYPEIQRFVRTFENVTILTPKKTFSEVISEYGYPIISKAVANTVSLAKRNIQDGKYSYRLMLLGISPEQALQMGLALPDDELLQKCKASVDGSKFRKPKYQPLLYANFNVSAMCCNVMKKKPANDYAKSSGRKPFIATMAEESMLREASWMQHGCNAFDLEHQASRPMSFWTEQDVLQYITENDLKIAEPYGEIVTVDDDGKQYADSLIPTDKPLKCTGCQRTGCIYCAFGAHLEKESRFVRLKQTHPKQYAYCIGGGAFDDKGIWKPNEDGLGLGYVFDRLNEMYSKDGKEFIKYK